MKKLVLKKNGEVVQRNMKSHLLDVLKDVQSNNAFQIVSQNKEGKKLVSINATTIAGDVFCWTIQED